MKESAVISERRKGSMAVEACIFLPISLFLLVAMAGAFQFLQLEESLLFSGFYRLQALCVQKATEPEVAAVEEYFLEHRITSSAETDMGKEAFRHCRVKRSTNVDWTAWISGTGDENGACDDDDDFRKELVEYRIECRWTVGSGKGGDYLSDELQFCGRAYSGEDRESVWIFPNWGERYHRRDCTVTGGERRRWVKDMAVQKGYTPCMICMGEMGGEDETSLGEW